MSSAVAVSARAALPLCVAIAVAVSEAEAVPLSVAMLLPVSVARFFGFGSTKKAALLLSVVAKLRNMAQADRILASKLLKLELQLELRNCATHRQ